MPSDLVSEGEGDDASESSMMTGPDVVDEDDEPLPRRRGRRLAAAPVEEEDEGEGWSYEVEVEQEPSEDLDERGNRPDTDVAGLSGPWARRAQKLNSARSAAPANRGGSISRIMSRRGLRGLGDIQAPSQEAADAIAESQAKSDIANRRVRGGVRRPQRLSRSRNISGFGDVGGATAFSVSTLAIAGLIAYVAFKK